MRYILVVCLCCFALVARAQQAVQVPSLQTHGGAALALIGHWFPTERTGARPAVVLLHGCGGAYDRRGELDVRMRRHSALLNAEGWHVLVLDSLTPRGEKELCTQKIGSRAVTQTHRRRDALGALQWLAARADVDAGRLALLGSSNGGSTVLAATNTRLPGLGASAKPRAAVAFYPGCESDLKRGYTAVAPLLLLVGGNDDWTAPGPCVELAQRAGAQIEVYPGAYHGFDASAPLRLRRDVPNGVNPGQGVHVGGDPVAGPMARQRLLEFLRQQLGQP